MPETYHNDNQLTLASEVVLVTTACTGAILANPLFGIVTCLVGAAYTGTRSRNINRAFERSIDAAWRIFYADLRACGHTPNGTELDAYYFCYDGLPH